MCTSIERKRAEAVYRMKMLHLHPDVIKVFDERGRIGCFEGCFGSLSRVEGNDLDRIRQIEEKNDLLVYAVVRGNCSMGIFDSYLFVSDKQGEWEADREDLKSSSNRGILAYVVNRSNPDNSDFLCIGVEESMFGSLKRTW